MQRSKHEFTIALNTEYGTKKCSIPENAQKHSDNTTRRTCYIKPSRVCIDYSLLNNFWITTIINNF